MKKETIERLVKESAQFITPIGNISVRQWPVYPFEPTDYYIDFSMGPNLYACEKIRDLAPEEFFVYLETLVYTIKSVEYKEWKYTTLRELKFEELGI